MKKEITTIVIVQENLLNKKARMSYFQIFTMIVALFAFSYIYGEIFGENNFFSEIIPSVDAQSTNVCCEETLTGNSCQTIPGEFCNPEFSVVPTDCEATQFCEIGCCISENTGLCNERTSRRDCEKIGGTFKSGEACTVSECRKGCCILGDQAKWTTEKNCEFERNSENEDILTEWRFDENSDTELKCLFNVEKDLEGACTFDNEKGEKACVFTTLEDCVSRTGSEVNFDREGKFCSDPLLETICEAKDHKECITGEEDVYWFDSCGNKEDVAEDCDLFGGTYCGGKDDNLFCKSVDCDIDGVIRKNGESWCTYDAAIGGGKDPAGSRHIKHICYLGTERLAPCSDFRNEICVQEDAETIEGSFSQAACRVNQWRTCLDYNQGGEVSETEGRCNENPDCWVKSIDMGGSFAFTVCLPAYPPGFELNVEANVLNDDGTLNEAAYYRPSSADGICSAATQRCTETWQCGIFGCTCIDNCLCHTSTFSQEMNDFCVSLGDCGAYINYIGVETQSGYTVRGAPRSASGFSQYGPQTGQTPAKPGGLAFFETLNPGSLPEVRTGSEGNLSAFERELQSASGAFGSPLLLEILTAEEGEPGVFENLDGLTTDSIGLSRFTNGFSTLQAAISAQIQTSDRSQGPDLSAMIAMIAGLIAYVITQSIIVAMLAALLAFLLAISWIEFRDIDFTCLPWDPPSGGADCNKCNTLDVPCSEYRCNSLGTLCHIINKGSGNELCVAREANETPPIIVPFDSAISEGFKYHNVNRDGFEVVDAETNRCIEAYTSVDIGIKVSPFAKCRISDSPEDEFLDMFEPFGVRGNSILPAHVTKLFFPNPEAFRNIYNLTDAQIEELGKVDLYVKCRTATGKVNPTPYHISTCINPGPDLTPPRVTLTNPQRGGFLEFGQTEQDVIVYTNEPSHCRWSIEDKDYDEMEHEMNCEANPTFFTQFGWTCDTTFTDLDENEQFFIRCRDISENANTMSESFIYEVQSSESDLEITDIIPTPGEEFISGFEPITTKLRLRTSGGARNGEAICRWEGNGYGDRFNYDEENGSKSHDYDVRLLRGQYNIDFFCEDIAGNTAENSTDFVIKIDSFGPKITRIYYDGGLKVTTSEDAECRFGFSSRTNFDNYTKMSGTGLEHHTGWNTQTYYVQCQDEFGNKGGKVRVKPVGVG